MATHCAAHHIDAAIREWDAAPAHVKLIAGRYMQPVLWALSSIAMELDSLRENRRGIPGNEEKGPKT